MLEYDQIWRWIYKIAAALGRLLGQPVVFVTALAVAGLVIASLLIWSLFRSFKHWNDGWLSTLVDEQLKEATAQGSNFFASALRAVQRRISRPSEMLQQCKHGTFVFMAIAKRYVRAGILSDLRQGYFPTVTSFAVIMIFIVFMVYYTGNQQALKAVASPASWLSPISSDVIDRGTVLTVFGGLVAIIFALIVFVSESIRDAKHAEQRRVLLRTSWLWPLAVGSVMTLMSFMLLSVTKLTLLLFVLLAATTVLSFARVIRAILDPAALASGYSKLLKERTRGVIRASARQRIANGILLSKVGADKDIKFQYALSPSWIGSGDNPYVFIDSVREGRISDINLSELESLFRLLQRHADRLNIRLSPGTGAQVADAGTNLPVRPVGQRTEEGTKPVYLLKRFGQWLQPKSIFSRDSKAILAIPAPLADIPKLLDAVRASLDRVFEFDAHEESSSIFRRELQFTKDQLLAAIRSASLGQVEELKAIYVHIAETFLETMLEFGGGVFGVSSKGRAVKLFRKLERNRLA